MSLRGRYGIFHLVEQCRNQAVDAERPITMLLGPRGSGASDAHHAIAEQFGAQEPFAYVNFDADQVLLPRYALALLARQLERQWKEYRRCHFPRLTLALLASDEELHPDPAGGPNRFRHQVQEFHQRAESRFGDYLGGFLTIAGGALGLPGGMPEVVASAVGDVARRGRNWLTGTNPGHSARWFGSNRLIGPENPWDALRELNTWRHDGTEEQRRQLDRVLFTAFLDDLRHNAGRWFAARSYLLLLDNCHTDEGSTFLEQLLRARHESRVAGAPCDPLIVVSSANRWLVQWGPSTGEQWPWRPRDPDRASLADWREHRPEPDNYDFWWYPLRLRDLNMDEVRTRVELTAPRQAASAAFVHELTSGLPSATQQVVAVLDGTGAPRERGAERERWLRALPAHRLPPAHGGQPLVTAALDHLLAGLTEERREALVECAAAEDLARGSQALGALGPGGAGLLFHEVRARWLLHPPGQTYGRQPPLQPPTRRLHHWLGRLLLWRLASEPDRWRDVHTRLADHFVARGETVEYLYHRLALQELCPPATGEADRQPIDEVVEYLAGTFPAMDMDRWVAELNRVTTAPNRLPPDHSPLAMVGSMAPQWTGESITRESVIRVLVCARWVWSDPLGDPLMRLNDVIADQYMRLAEWRGSDIVRLHDEAERYRRWRRPLSHGEGW